LPAAGNCHGVFPHSSPVLFVVGMIAMLVSKSLGDRVQMCLTLLVGVAAAGTALSWLEGDTGSWFNWAFLTFGVTVAAWATIDLWRQRGQR
jgi:hypothetical protein